MERGWGFPEKLELEVSRDSAILLLGVTEGRETSMLTVVLVITARTGSTEVVTGGE